MVGKPGRTQTLQEDGDGVGRIFREPVNGLTHAVGALFSAVALVVLVREAVAQGPMGAVVGAGIFGTSLVLLYSASALYHLLPLSERGIAILRRLDHAMIYVLIAGTYSPVLLGALGGPWGWTLFGLVWGLALVGILLKIVWFGTPRWLTVLFYVGLGLLVIPMLPFLLEGLPARSLLWIGVGGVFYLVGAAIYGFRWPNLSPGRFGFHELWHLFVMAGSASHVWAVWILMRASAGAP
ncbi:MAG: hemolysin III family protein [Firmicutes bacterium]|nr:hemolysin III family protein [Bacillota bacterium]